jgi:hypothetical protein
MPAPNMLPGVKGKDYRFVKGPNGKVYVVYRVKIGPNRYVRMSWTIPKEDYKAFGVKPDAVSRIGRRAFKHLNWFGEAGENVARGRTGGELHPFQKFIRDLHEQHRGASWLKDAQFMRAMLMGEMEGWSAGELENVLKKTKWYQSRTDAQRRWALEMGKADRQASLESTMRQVQDALGDIYGEGADWTQEYNEKELKRISQNIASGKWGDPSEGFQLWFSNATSRAEKVEGTAAWIAAQQEAEAQRAFMNRPEDIREQIRQEAFEWLGPQGVPDEEALIKWSEDLASENRSDGDWQSFIQGQAKALFPWLGPQERWMDRAGSYKRILEEQFGTAIGWDDPLLGQLGAVDETGGFTGEAVSWDQFTKLARQDDRFWQSDLGKKEGFEIFSLLNETFRGVR